MPSEPVAYVDLCVCASVRLSVCLSVCLSAHISQEPHVRTSPPNFTHVARCCGAFLLWRRRDTLCTSGFVDDVMDNGLYVKRECDGKDVDRWDSHDVRCAFIARGRTLSNAQIPLIRLIVDLLDARDRACETLHQCCRNVRTSVRQHCWSVWTFRQLHVLLPKCHGPGVSVHR